MNYCKMTVRCVCMLSVLVALLGGESAGATATAQPTFTCGKWNVVESPDPSLDYNTLNSVAAVSPDDVWAVGSADGTLIAHWNGAVWQVVAPPKIVGFLLGVTALSANNVWAVGWSRPQAGEALTLVEHWDGSTWSIVKSPSVGNYSNELTSVFALSPGDIWAVGFDQLKATQPDSPVRTLVEHWDGSTWSIVKSPSVGSSDYLNGVSGTSSSDIWAVGYSDAVVAHHLVFAPLAEHWNGSGWQIVPTPNTSSQLLGVTAIASNDVWAVGTLYGTDHVNGTLTEQWNGSRWSIVPSPVSGQGDIPQFSGVAASGANNVWAVGSDTLKSGNATPLTAHWDGKQWSQVHSPRVGAAYTDLLGVMMDSAHGVWAVGDEYAFQGDNVESLIEYYC